MNKDDADRMARLLVRREFVDRMVVAAIGSAIPMITMGIVIGVLLSRMR